MLRRLRYIVAAAALVVTGAVPPAMAADSHFGNVQDERGDVPDGRGDIFVANASYYGKTNVSKGEVTLDLHIDLETPTSDHAWNGDTGIIWLIDTDLNGDADWAVTKSVEGVEFLDAAGEPACGVRDMSRIEPNPDFSRYEVLFDPACIGGAREFSWSVLMFWDADGRRGNNDPQVDVAPENDGWSHPISAWGGSPPAESQGYWTVGSDRQLLPFGRATHALGPTPLSAPVVGAAAAHAVPGGVWMVAADGGIFTVGDAGFFGSMGGKPLNQPIVGMAATPTRQGYWLVARDGGIFTFGDAAFHGSTGAMRLNQPIVGMAATVTGDGYWLVAADGGIFAFGDAPFLGSMGHVALNQPVVGIARTINGDGYWMVARDGGIFSLGAARFHGSAGHVKLNQPIVGMSTSTAGNGYRFVAADGGVFTFGDARFEGSGTGRVTKQVVAIVTA